MAIDVVETLQELTNQRIGVLLTEIQNCSSSDEEKTRTCVHLIEDLPPHTLGAFHDQA
jgi:hypothetical protein